MLEKQGQFELALRFSSQGFEFPQLQACKKNFQECGEGWRGEELAKCVKATILNMCRDKDLEGQQKNIFKLLKKNCVAALRDLRYDVFFFHPKCYLKGDDNHVISLNLVFALLG